MLLNFHLEPKSILEFSAEFFKIFLKKNWLELGEGQGRVGPLPYLNRGPIP